ncbi:serine hydrolase domain-containing protein [Paenibacillus cymbidii]|uniref:serine hydrolase domain-containing protein n=1 Tax=Paenibacillus cymbidii TaxID=1639034 RepID=UPI0010815231|nr:serine hydrolase domain-containing protein [Paenibacillus cymbidii]
MHKEAHAEAARRMGMRPEGVEAALRLIDDNIASGEIPGGVAVVSRRGATVRYAAGLAVDYGGNRIPATEDTVYDCASLTKVVVTLPLLLKLIERGKATLSDPVAMHVPEFAGGGKESVTIGQLLTHTSGLMAFTDMHSHGWSPERINAFVMEQPLEYEPGTQVVYSDMGYIVLGRLIEKLTGLALPEAARRDVFEPLGMAESGYLPAAERKPRLAATEHYAYESGPRIGIVHDENASALGGVSGHAGLFASAGDLARYADAWLDACRGKPTPLLSPAAARAATRCHTATLASGKRGLGWALRGDKFDASGDLLGLASFGHTGYTGTSLYVDPELGLTAVLLTNRVHYGRSKSVARLRAAFHNALAAAVTEWE